MSGRLRISHYHFPARSTQTKEITLHVIADVVMADVPVLISKKTLVEMKGRLNLNTPSLTIGDNVTIQQANLPSGLFGLPGPFKLVAEETSQPSATLNDEPATSSELYPVLKEQCLTPISDDDFNKVHQRLSHCGARTLGNLLRAWAGLLIMTKSNASWENAPVGARRIG